MRHPFALEVLAAYLRQHLPGFGGELTAQQFEPRVLAALGIPREDPYVQAYCKRSGRASLPDWDYNMAFNVFRLARPIAEVGWRQVTGRPFAR